MSFGLSRRSHLAPTRVPPFFIKPKQFLGFPDQRWCVDLQDDTRDADHRLLKLVRREKIEEFLFLAAHF